MGQHKYHCKSNIKLLNLIFGLGIKIKRETETETETETDTDR